MLTSQIISDVRKELLETTAQFWSDSELIRYINRAVADFIVKTRINEREAELSLVVGQSDYPLPSNWSSARLVLFKEVRDDGSYQWVRIYPFNLEKAAQQMPNFLNNSTDNQGRPTRYFIWNRRLFLNKAPNVEFATTIHLFFKSKPIPVAAATDTIDLEDDLAEAITAFVLWKAWKKEQETDLADEQKDIYFSYVAEGRKWVKRQVGDLRNRIDIDSQQSLDGNFFPFGPLTD